MYPVSPTFLTIQVKKSIATYNPSFVVLPSLSLEGVLYSLLSLACHVFLCLLKDENRGDVHLPFPESAAKFLWLTWPPHRTLHCQSGLHGENVRVHIFLILSSSSEVPGKWPGKKKVKCTYKQVQSSVDFKNFNAMLDWENKLCFIFKCSLFNWTSNPTRSFVMVVCNKKCKQSAPCMFITTENNTDSFTKFKTASF